MEAANYTPEEYVDQWTAQGDVACGAWKTHLGVKANPARVRDQMITLAKWLTGKPNTTRYMTPEQLRKLRGEIIDGLIAQGTSREGAEELTATLPAVASFQSIAETRANLTNASKL
jgi:hypothetical protein